MSRIAFQTEARAGAVALVNGYRQAATANLGMPFRARPAQIKPPAVFIDSVSENTDAFTNRESQRTVRVGIRFVWGVYDAGSTVDARDKVIDGFYAHVADNGDHALGANTVCSWIAVTDDETWQADWLPPAMQPMYSTLVVLEGLAST